MLQVASLPKQHDCINYLRGFCVAWGACASGDRRELCLSLMCCKGYAVRCC